MTDPAQTPQQATPPTDQSADPLKALEDALKNTGADAPVDPAVTPTEPPKPDPAVEEAKQRAELKTLETQHNETDAQDIKAQIESLHQLTENTPKHVSEAPVEPVATSQQAEDKAGFEIHQIDHKKVPGTS